MAFDFLPRRLHGVSIAAGLAALLGATPASAVLRITEVMSNGDSTDWFEVTNYGSTAFSLTSSWRMDDNSFNYDLGAELMGIMTIDPSQSVIFVEGNEETAAAFRSDWNLGAEIKIGYYSGSGISFSSGGDGATVWSSSSVEETLRVSFGSATPGVSFHWTYSTDSGTPIAGPSGGSLSVSGVNGAFANSFGRVGSPGAALSLIDPTTLVWAGGTGTWAATGGMNWQGGAWNPLKTAVFNAPSGTVTVNDDVTSVVSQFES